MVKKIITSDQMSSRDLVGGKGFQLQQLRLWQARVPAFIIIPTTVYEDIKKQFSLPQELIRSVEDFIDEHGPVVLRSSMVGEDQLDASFAGLFETVLGQTKSTWQESLLRIYNSMTTPRVLEYIQQKSIKTSLKMAVVVQKEIPVEKSGVLFTRNPIEPTSFIAIDAAFGMGEGVVSGYVDVDHILISRLGEIALRTGEKVLSEENMSLLLKESLRLEKKFKQAADIEWGFYQNELFIFQIRPITRTFEPLGYFADTNLSESYPGSVSPLTAKFVQKAYANVFMESAEHLGMREERKQKIFPHTQELIAHIDHHLYYNLEHYYAALRASPGGDKNIENWHKMIGGKLDGIEVPYHETRGSFYDNFLSAFNFLRIALLRNKIFPDLISSFEVIGKKIQDDIKKLSSSAETIRYLNHLLNQRMNFGLTIINDFFIMIGLGYLTKSLDKKGLSQESLVDLLKTESNIDSVKPLAAFQELMATLSHDFIHEFIHLQPTDEFFPYENIFSQLDAKGFQLEVEKMKKFISTFGDRSFEELKLESLPIKNDPVILQQLMRWTRLQHSPSRSSHLKTFHQVQIKFNILERWFLRFTRESIEYRESSRLWRGRFYHYYRELIIKLAQQLKHEEHSFRQFKLRDFFSVNHEEWFAFAQGQLTRDQIQEWMKIRLWRDKKNTYPEFYIGVLHAPLAFKKDSALNQNDRFQGMGVSPGEALGVALVLEAPQDIFQYQLENFILVTKNTDPAWVYIMSQSQALISEKGSLLSHTAIIGRELGLPTVVGLKDATKIIKTGDRLKVNGSTGLIEVL